MVVAEFTIIPTVSGSLRPYVKKALTAVEESGLKYEVGAMGTTIEGELDQVLSAIREAHRRTLASGVKRVITEIRLDERVGGLSIEEKVKGFRR